MSVVYWLLANYIQHPTTVCTLIKIAIAALYLMLKCKFTVTLVSVSIAPIWFDLQECGFACPC